MIDDTEDGQNNETDNRTGKGKKGGGKFTGTGAMGQTRAAISPAFFDVMKRFGASMEQITRILREWVHLKGEELVKRLKEFARGTARASAHALVQFTKGGGFALVTDFLLTMSGHEPAPAIASTPVHQPR